MAVQIVSGSLPNIPWEERPAGCDETVWRFSRNPVVGRYAAKTSHSVLNSAVVPFGEGFAGVFRCDDRSRHMDIHAGRSADGIHWEIEPGPIRFRPESPAVAPSEYKYDPRITPLDGRYYITWCAGYHGPCIGLGYTDDFAEFVQMEHITLPYNRNGVLFPRRIKGTYAMLSRPSDTGHTQFGDIFYSESPDLVHWGRHRFVMAPCGGWQSTKIGAGPVPLETSEGWLLIYHGVLTSCNGFVYSMGAALLDLEEPWKVVARGADYLLAPAETYECVGDTPNVVFPCAMLCDGDTGRLAIYYGGADTVVCLAFSTVDAVVRFVRERRR